MQEDVLLNRNRENVVAAPANANYAMAVLDVSVALASSNSSSFTCTLPPVFQAKGRTYFIRLATRSSTGVYTVQNQDDSPGWTDIVLSTAGQLVVARSDGQNWIADVYNGGLGGAGSVVALADAAISAAIGTGVSVANVTVTGAGNRVLILPPVAQMAGRIVIVYCVAIATGDVNITQSAGDAAGAYVEGAVMTAAGDFIAVISTGSVWLELAAVRT